MVTVEKGFNGKPYPNASVIFHAVREEQTDANLKSLWALEQANDFALLLGKLAVPKQT